MPTDAQRRRALIVAMNYVASHGVTFLHDPAIRDIMKRRFRTDRKRIPVWHSDPFLASRTRFSQ